jgi:hypothetical protein
VNGRVVQEVDGLEVPVHPHDTSPDTLVPTEVKRKKNRRLIDSPYVILPKLVEYSEDDDDMLTTPRPWTGCVNPGSGDEKEGNEITPGLDCSGASSTDWVKGERGKRTFAFLQEVVVLNGWETKDLSSYTLCGGRPRIRALSDWFEWGIAPLNKSPEQIAQDLHPEKSLTALLQTLKQKG